MKTPSQRQLRVGEMIRHALAEVLSRGDLRDPQLANLVITVPEVRMSPDLMIATVYVMPLGGKGQDKVIKALAREAKGLRRELARRVEMKFLPKLRFQLDTTFEEADRIEALLAGLHSDDRSGRGD